MPASKKNVATETTEAIAAEAVAVDESAEATAEADSTETTEAEAEAVSQDDLDAYLAEVAPTVLEAGRKYSRATLDFGRTLLPIRTKHLLAGKTQDDFLAWAETTSTVKRSQCWSACSAAMVLTTLPVEAEQLPIGGLVDLAKVKDPEKRRNVLDALPEAPTGAMIKSAVEKFLAADNPETAESQREKQDRRITAMSKSIRDDVRRVCDLLASEHFTAHEALVEIAEIVAEKLTNEERATIMRRSVLTVVNGWEADHPTPAPVEAPAVEATEQ